MAGYVGSSGEAVLKLLFCDTETYCGRPLAQGTFQYAEAAEVLLFSFATDDGPSSVWDLTTGEPMPAELEDGLLDERVLTVWHNGRGFDLPVMKFALPYVYKLLPIERIYDTMCQALAHGLPGGLDALCEVMGVAADERKLKTGREFITLFCKPPAKNLKRARATRLTHPKEWEGFKEYARRDIPSMRAIHKKMPMWNYPYEGPEMNLSRLDYKINNRGFQLDLDLAHAAIRAVDREQKVLAKRTVELTNGEVEKATQRDKLLAHLLSEYGVDLPDLQKSTLERRVNDPDLPWALRELLAIRLQASASSTSKYRTAIKGASNDGRIRGTLQFDGAARTRRWAGRLWQPQNLARPTIPKDEIEAGIRAMKADCEDLIYPSVMALASSAMRGMIIPSKGKKLIVADLSNIEGRATAWLAGEEWKVQAFRNYDTIIGTDAKGKPVRGGHDLYKMAYSKSFGVAPELVDDDQRQVGKVQELACIAEGELVLTNAGLIPIQEIKLSHKVWDGISWVQHSGVVFRGIKDVIDYEGLSATEDHLVWVEGVQGPIRFQEAACGSHLVQSGDGRIPIRLGRNHVTGASLHKRVVGSLCFDSMRKLWSSRMDMLFQFAKRKIKRLSAMFKPEASPTLVGQANGSRKITLYQPQRSCLSILRSQGDRISILFCASCLSLYYGKYWFASAFANRSNKYFRALRTRQFAVCYLSRESTQSKTSSNAGRYMGFRSMAVFAKSNNALSIKRDDTRRDNGTSLHGSSGTPQELARNSRQTRKVRVFDILNCGPLNRFTVSNKLVHNCGYGGGVGAYLQFSLLYNLDLEAMAEAAESSIPRDIWEDAQAMWEWTLRKKRTTFGLSRRAWTVCESFVLAWRKGHPEIAGVKFDDERRGLWGDMEDAVKNATSIPGVTFQCRGMRVRRDGMWLRIRLPSGNYLCYPSPRIDGSQWSYMGVNQYTRKWTRIKSFGGRLTENSSQSFSRDILAANMQPAEKAGYEILITNHDEILAEAPDSSEFNAEHLSSILATVPSWAPGMPLAAAGFEGYRYRKG